MKLYLEKLGTDFLPGSPEALACDLGCPRLRLEFIDRDGIRVSGDVLRSAQRAKIIPSLAFDLEYTDRSGLHRYTPMITWRAPFTREGVLLAVNGISAVQYDAVEVVARGCVPPAAHDYPYDALRLEQERSLFETDPAEAAALAAYEAERARPTQNAEGVHVGDIYYASWGWEQTNVDYFQVVSLRGAHTVALRPVRARCVDDPRAMTGLCRPLRDVFENDAPPILVRSSADEKGSLRMCIPVGSTRCFLRLTAWGVAERYSTYA